METNMGDGELGGSRVSPEPRNILDKLKSGQCVCPSVSLPFLVSSDSCIC